MLGTPDSYQIIFGMLQVFAAGARDERMEQREDDEKLDRGGREHSAETQCPPCTLRDKVFTGQAGGRGWREEERLDKTRGEGGEAERRRGDGSRGEVERSEEKGRGGEERRGDERRGEERSG
eukprot:768452-Hanusia_phi.AAC.1